MAPFAKHNRLSPDVNNCSYLPYETFMKQYSIKNEISCGGFGTVYAATRNFDNRPAAIKLVPNQSVCRWSLLEDRQVPIEVALLAKCQSIPGVIRIYHYTKGPRGFLIAMERIEFGIDLFEFVVQRQKGYLTEATARKILRQIVETLKSCAEIGVVHLDIKPENIIISTESEVLKLIDFGSGAWLTDTPYLDFHGTRQFAPPEWFLYREYDAMPATVWSLGIFLYAVLIGEYPYNNRREIIGNSFEWGKKISYNCQSLILSCLASAPEDRLSLEDILRHSWLTESGTDYGLNEQWKRVEFVTKATAYDNLYQSLEKFFENENP